MDNVAPCITIKSFNLKWCGTLGGHTIILQWFNNEYSNLICIQTDIINYNM
jgi:hypothetical protein